MTVSGAKIWLSIEEMELIAGYAVTTLVANLEGAVTGNTSGRINQNTIDELWVKIQQELDGIKKYNEVEN
jgi:hypothetical protein